MGEKEKDQGLFKSEHQDEEDEVGDSLLPQRGPVHSSDRSFVDRLESFDLVREGLGLDEDDELEHDQTRESGEGGIESFSFHKSKNLLSSVLFLTMLFLSLLVFSSFNSNDGESAGTLETTKEEKPSDKAEADIETVKQSVKGQPQDTSEEESELHKIIFRDAYIQPSDLPAGNGTCEEEANKHIQAALEAIGKDRPGPIVVGGIGDSGTRGIQILLGEMGVDLGYFNHAGIPDSALFTYDSLTFMNTVPVRLCNPSDRIEMVNAHYMYAEIMRKYHTVSYSKDSIANDNLWYAGLQYIAKITEQMENRVRQDAKVDKTLLPRLMFGFKHPRTALVLPFFKAALGSQFKFVHVLRDGRDVGNGRNKRMFRSLCDDYFNKTCSKDLKERLEFWAALNLEVYKWATENLGADQYYVIRIEDVIDGNIDCMKGLAQFLHIDESKFASLVTKAYVNTTFLSHQSSYSGRKWSDAKSKKLTQGGLGSDIVQSAFKTFGYLLQPERPWKRKYSCLPQPQLRF